MSLPTDKKVPGSFPDYALGLSSSKDLFKFLSIMLEYT